MDRYKAIVITVLLLVITGCSGGHEPGSSGRRMEVTGVSTEPVVWKDVQDYYITTGTVRAVETSEVSSRIMGEVSEILVDSGSRVRKGQVLLRITSPDLVARRQAAEEAAGEAERALAMAKSEMLLAEKTFTRYRALFEEKVITEQEYDEVATRRELARIGLEMAGKALEKARASLKAVEAQLSYGVVRSPVTGIVAEKRIDVGSTSMPGQPLMIIEAMPYRIEAAVDEKMLPYIKKGSIASVEVGALGMNFNGRVAEIVHTIDQRTRTFKVKLNIEDSAPGLRSGMYARVKFPSGERKTVLVKSTAIVRRGDLAGVYTVNDQGVISMRLVRTGESRDGMTEILSGLRPGERIIVSGTDRAVDGGIVR
jgi:RND family efflux transporter MFP subunit